jgi:hypothetical protein
LYGGENDCRSLANSQVKTGGAEYGSPEIQEIIEVREH